MKIRNILKKTLAVILSLAMLAPILSNLEVNVKEVQAAETSTDDSLNVKCQVTQGVVKTTTIDKYKDKYVMRFVSAIEDYTQYKEIGFKLIEEGTTKEKKGVVKTVFKRIESTTGSTADGTKETYTYSPKVINTAGEYFMTAKLPIDNTEEAKAAKYTVWAYGIKKDGTLVNGPERCVSVNDGLEGCQTINMSFDSSISVSTDDALTANGLPAEVIGVSKDGKRVHVRITPGETVLNSATLFEFQKNDTKIGEEIFRNLNTKYAGEGTADISWYDVYKNTTDEFVIATSADWYGFAKAVNSAVNGNSSFANKTVYLVSDIEANQGYADKTNLTWNSSLAADGTTAITGTSYPWTAIASTTSGTNYFSGTFDGQMHTISGIYMDTSESYRGLFSGTDNSAQIRNFYLKNSYFVSNDETLKTEQLGSIVGNARGTFENIYSDAIVVSNGCKYAGGILGGTAGSGSVTMNNCWFAGSVTANAKQSYYGGLIGATRTKSTITNCLNEGDVTHTASVGTAGIGGFVGHITNSATVDVAYSINTGNVKRPSSAYWYGLFFGRIESGTATATYSHSTNHTDKMTVGASDSKGTDPYSNCHKFNTNQLAGLAALTTTTSAAWDNARKLFTADEAKGYWSITQSGLPVLTTFEKEATSTAQAVDTRWYDTSKNEYTLMDSGDLYGFALLARTNSFKGKKVTLGADIEVNKGKATETGWNTTMSADGRDITDGTNFPWLPIGQASGDYYFNGEFDGRMHTISGIYLDTSSSYQGLFAATNTSSEIRNFYLKNSYFVLRSGNQLGSIAGNTRGTFENIYSNAVVVSEGGHTVGGLFGATASSGGFNASNCWFAGSVICNVNQNYFGGLIGHVKYDSTIKNCLNTASVTNNGTTQNSKTAGFVGCVADKLDILHSVNAGTVTVNASGAYNNGLFVGEGSDSLNIQNSHSLSKAGYQLVGNKENSVYEDTCGIYSVTEVAGINALTQAKIGKLFTEEAAKGYWSITKDSFPVLTSFEKGSGVVSQAVDTSWYTDSENEYTLIDSGDLYGFALLSQTHTFTGKTIKLGADIEVNKGKATAMGWDTTRSADGSNITNGTDFLWLPIGWTSGNPNYFNGKFDGQMHTISGIYLSTNELYRGLFAGTNNSAEIKNFYLKNSYFYHERCETSDDVKTGQFGSIVGNARGTFDTIYSDAIVRSCNYYAGGMIGGTAGSGSVTMNNCWFAGSVDCAKAASYYGGLIGHVRTTTTITNCMNTGDITNELASSAAGTGGFVGHVVSTVNIYNSLNTGNAKYKSGSAYYGLFVGKNEGTVNANSSYSSKYAGKWLEGDSSTGVDPDNYVNCTRYDLINIKGTDALINIPSLFADSSQDYWVCVEDGAPVLASFAKNLGITTIQAVDFSATSQEVEDLASLYGGRKLYQGELHDHADTSVGSNDGTSDGYTELDKWFSQMEEKGLDFAASLDHKQTSHIDSEYWDVSKLIYGTEASVTITDQENEYHFNMLFKNKSDLMSVLQNEEFGFKYEQTTILDSVYWPNRDNNGQAEFVYPSLLSSTFKTLIQSVQADKKGFFVLPHPLNYEDNQTEGIEAYAFADGIGLEVMYAPNGTDEGQKMYEGWMKLLADGHKIYACAGSDSHRDLNNQALTSIYAKVLDNHTACTDDTAKRACSSTECNKGNMIETLAEGNFVAGSVGIKMSVGDTLMGGTCDFANQRVVVDVDKIHASAYDASHKYRLDVMNEDGIVYYKYLTFTKDVATDDVLGDDFAFNADAESQFYRVVITDVTTGKRIAIGNPIWNSNQ